jgi:hypothetical protein
MQVSRASPVAMEARAPNSRCTYTIILLATVPLVLALSLFLAARRALGAMIEPLPPLLLVRTALVALAWVWLARIAACTVKGGAESAATRTRYWLLWCSPWLTLLFIAYACSYPVDRAVDWLVWMVTMAAAWLGPRIIGVREKHAARPATASKLRSPAARVTSDADRVLQQLTRYRTADGREIIRGTLMAEFAPGERQATLYVGFCPPFKFLPAVEAEIADTDAATVKLTQVLHNGAQIDVRLSQPARTQADLVVDIVAAERHRDDASSV